ncbi:MULTISPECIES: DUF2771 domain-containing protein [unclassified Streptomyces]|uniref:DUF2771 domain-containing protein n=1 Tax=unclassified Streptomyces TaxID=2593676 RepID=UPI00369F6374
MTVAFFSGSRRRTAVALGAVSAGLLVLSACDKPTPVATLTVGTDSVHAEASCYNGGDAIKESEVQGCLNKKAEKSLTVASDDKIRFGVDPEIADNGWTIFLGGQQAEAEPYKKTYRTIPASAFFTSSQTGETVNDTQVTIVENTGKKLTGIWHFQLKKES